MANVTSFYEKVAIDYLCGGLTATRPVQWGLALGVTVPTSTSTMATWEVGTASGYSAISMPFPPASSPAGTAANTLAATFGPFSTACTISGMCLKDTTATAGSAIFYGTLATARTLGIGDSIVYAIGALTVSLS